MDPRGGGGMGGPFMDQYQSGRGGNNLLSQSQTSLGYGPTPGIPYNPYQGFGMSKFVTPTAAVIDSKSTTSPELPAAFSPTDRYITSSAKIFVRPPIIL
eukprot:sb/3478786/